MGRRPIFRLTVSAVASVGTSSNASVCCFSQCFVRFFGRHFVRCFDLLLRSALLPSAEAPTGRPHSFRTKRYLYSCKTESIIVGYVAKIDTIWIHIHVSCKEHTLTIRHNLRYKVLWRLPYGGRHKRDFFIYVDYFFLLITLSHRPMYTVQASAV